MQKFTMPHSFLHDVLACFCGRPSWDYPVALMHRTATGTLDPRLESTADLWTQTSPSGTLQTVWSKAVAMARRLDVRHRPAWIRV
eukprot:642874-Amphidinium_carterae.1